MQQLSRIFRAVSVSEMFSRCADVLSWPHDKKSRSRAVLGARVDGPAEAQAEAVASLEMIEEEFSAPLELSEEDKHAAGAQRR